MAVAMHLHFVGSNRSPYEIPVQGETIIGRGEGCDINLTHYYRGDLLKVSRQHCKIAYQNGHFVIVDLLSKNETWVNGYRLTPNRARTLRNSDEIRIADDPELRIRVQIRESRDPDETEPVLEDFVMQELLKELREHRDILLLGVAGSGKSTILTKLVPQSQTQHLFDELVPDHRSLLFCRVNCMAIPRPTLESFFHLLVRATKPAFESWPGEIRRNAEMLATRKCSFEEIVSALATTIRVVDRELERRVVFLLDQFDDLYPKLPEELFGILKEIKTVKPEPVYVIAMRNEFDGSNPYIHQLLRVLHPPRSYWLPAMSDDALEAIIARFQIRPDEVKRSIDLGGQQPRLTELVARVISDMNPAPSQDSSLINLLLLDSFIVDHCREMWESLSPTEQEALQTVVQGRPTMSFSTQQQLTARKMLLVGDSEDLRVRSALFGAYIRLQSEGARPTEQNRASSEGVMSEQIEMDGHFVPRECLTKREEMLLRYLVSRAGAVCSFDEISDHVWGYDPPASQESISSLVHNLRQKLDEISPGAGKRHIKNVHGRGYRYLVRQT